MVGECPGPREDPAVGGGQKAVAPEGSPGPDHLRQVRMGRHLLLLGTVSWGCFRDWCSACVRAVARGEDFLF